MGCWGITAFESDAGLDAAGIIREHLPQDGKLDLGKCIEAIQMAGWSVPDVTEGYSHTGPMVLAEILVKFLDRDIAIWIMRRIGLRMTINSVQSLLLLHPKNPSVGCGITFLTR